MYVTRHSSITDVTVVEKFWHLYELAYAPTTTETVTREMLYRSEFDAVLADPTNRIWALWDDSRPIAMIVIATQPSATHYLSSDFFERNYNDHLKRGVVHYVIWMAVHPLYAIKNAVFKLMQEPFRLEAQEGALLVFDAPQMNQRTERGGMLEMTRRLASAIVGGAPVHEIEVHRYFAADFAESGHSRLARERERERQADAAQPARR